MGPMDEDLMTLGPPSSTKVPLNNIMARSVTTHVR